MPVSQASIGVWQITPNSNAVSLIDQEVYRQYFFRVKFFRVIHLPMNAHTNENTVLFHRFQPFQCVCVFPGQTKPAAEETERVQRWPRTNSAAPGMDAAHHEAGTGRRGRRESTARGNGRTRRSPPRLLFPGEGDAGAPLPLFVSREKKAGGIRRCRRKGLAQKSKRGFVLGSLFCLVEPPRRPAEIPWSYIITWHMGYPSVWQGGGCS